MDLINVQIMNNNGKNPDHFEILRKIQKKPEATQREMAKELGSGKKIVTVLCDDANKYYDKMYNKEFLKSLNLPVPDWI